jgi:hypothetical protein
MHKTPGGGGEFWVHTANFATRGGLGYESLDDLIGNYYFEVLLPFSVNDEERENNLKFLEEIDQVANKYLNAKEKCIYFLVIHEKKRTADITIILNYNGWRTTQNSIDRVFKILKLYYDFDLIDAEELQNSISKNFNKIERKIIKLLENRYTIQEINNKLGKKFHYTKTHCLIKNIMNKLMNLGDPCEQYYDFLVEIRKFKDSCNFDEKTDNIRLLES